MTLTKDHRLHDFSNFVCTHLFADLVVSVGESSDLKCIFQNLDLSVECKEESTANDYVL